MGLAKSIYLKSRRATRSQSVEGDALRKETNYLHIRARRFRGLAAPVRMSLNPPFPFTI